MTKFLADKMPFTSYKSAKSIEKMKKNGYKFLYVREKM